MANIIKQVKDNAGNNVMPITHVSAVKDSAGTPLPEILDRDYPTTSKTPVEGSTEVSLVTRGEKYEWNKVGNATDATGASDITSNFKYLLLNGTTGEFETALKAYVEESVRAALGALVNNLDKGSSISTILATDSSNDLGTITPANLASVLSVYESWKFVNANSVYGIGNLPFSSGHAIRFKIKNASDYFLMIVGGSDNIYFCYSWEGNYSSWKKLI